MAGDILAFRQLNFVDKRELWRAEVFKQIDLSDQGQGVAGLSDEFRCDNQFWSKRICKFIGSAGNHDGIKLLTIGGSGILN